MAHVDLQYNKLVKSILSKGFTYIDKSRGNIELLQIPHYTLEIDMAQGFPLISSKQIFWKSVAHELIWMLSGSTSIQYLKDNGVNIWNKDAANYKVGNETHVGRIYGAQWRAWTGEYKKFYKPLDQITKLITGLKNDLHNRRHIVSAWNPAELDQMALPPCHWSFEVIPTFIAEENIFGFALKWHQRSCDTMLGIPFDIALYALLGKLIEKETGLRFVTLIGDLSNVHFYEPHIILAVKQLWNRPFDQITQLLIAKDASIFDLNINNLNISNYKHHPAIKAELFAKIN